MNTRIVLLITLIMLPPATMAEEVCNGDMTVRTCWEELKLAYGVNGPKGAKNNAQRLSKASGQTLLEKLPTSTTLPSLASTVNDFIPLAGFLGSVGVDDDQVEDYLGLSGTQSLLGGKGSLGVFSNTQPEVLGPLKELLRSQNQSAVIDQLEESLDLSDDMFFEARYSPEFWHFGRSWVRYEPWFGELLDASDETITTEDLDRWSWSRVEHEVFSKFGSNFNKKKIKELSASEIAFLTEKVQQVLQAVRAFENIHDKYHLGAYGELVNNQPQIIFSYRVLDREDIVNAGLDSWGITIETGLANLMFFDLLENRGENRCIEGGGFLKREKASYSKCLASYSNYVEDNFLLEHAVRFSLTYEQSDLDDISLDLDSLGSFNIPGTTRELWKIGAGAIVLPESKTRTWSARVDAVYEDETHDNNLFRNDRTLWRVTATIKNGQLSIPINLIFKEENEFRNDIEPKDITAIVGLRWDILRKPLKPATDVLEGLPQL